MQAFMYAWLFGRLPENSGLRICPGIYYMRTLFAGTFDPAIYERIERTKKTAVDDFTPYAAPFESALRTCLDDIFSPATPFIQTPTRKACLYCPYQTICG
jgi:hypothetical protein